jgi:hypothetical protein
MNLRKRHRTRFSSDVEAVMPRKAARRTLDAQYGTGLKTEG